MGISSFLTFPGKCSKDNSLKDINHFTPENQENLIGWAHCFRNPAEFEIPVKLPKLLFAHSDLIDVTHHYKQNTTKDKHNNQTTNATHTPNKT